MKTINIKTQEIGLKMFKKLVQSKSTNKNPIKIEEALNISNKIVINDFVNFTKEDYKIAIEVIENKEVNIEQIQNGAFYKEWSKIINMSEEEFRMDQILHYISRYVLDINAYRPEDKQKLIESKALVDEDSYFSINLLSFIDVLENKTNKAQRRESDINIKIYDSISWNEFVELIVNRLNSNIALDDNDIRDLFAEDGVLSLFDIDTLKYISDNTKNKQVKMMLSISFNIIPEDAKSFLEVITAISTSKILFIKNKDTFQTIKENSFQNIEHLFVEFGKVNPNALIDLASIYNRHKGIFLSIKSMKNNDNFNGLNLSQGFKVGNKKFKNHKHLINKIAKMSKKHHKPYLTSAYLELTSVDFDLKSFEQIIQDLDTSYIVKIANAFIVRLSMIENKTNILQVLVRNGKEFYTQIKLKSKDFYKTRLNIIKKILTKRINQNIIDKKIVFKNIKESVIKYAIPTSGKAFIYDIPFGSRIDFRNTIKTDKINKRFVAGIYWKDYNNHRSDWDLKARNAISMIGWNADYINNDLVFSGDLTEAPEGAAELLYTRGINNKPFAYNLSVEAFNIPQINNQYINPITFFVGYTSKHDDLNKLKDTEAQTLINKDSILSVTIKADGSPHARTNLGLLTEKFFVFQGTSNGFKSPSDMPSKETFEAYKIKNSSYLLFEDLDLRSYEPVDDKEEIKIIDFANISQADLLEFL